MVFFSFLVQLPFRVALRILRTDFLRRLFGFAEKAVDPLSAIALSGLSLINTQRAQFSFKEFSEHAYPRVQPRMKAKRSRPSHNPQESTCDASD
jgi:hypothetical protein